MDKLLLFNNLDARGGPRIPSSTNNPGYDPVKEEILGDEEANRLVNQPMRAPWHL